jgi:hypothetical protein
METMVVGMALVTSFGAAFMVQKAVLEAIVQMLTRPQVKVDYCGGGKEAQCGGAERHYGRGGVSPVGRLRQLN